MKIWAVGQTGGVAHCARYFCIDRCRFYFSSCTCVAALRHVKAVQEFSAGCSTGIRPQIDVPFIK